MTNLMPAVGASKKDRLRHEADLSRTSALLE